jgi:hypothetical protein
VVRLIRASMWVILLRTARPSRPRYGPDTAATAVHRRRRTLARLSPYLAFAYEPYTVAERNGLR